MDIVARAMAAQALSQFSSYQYKNRSEFPSVGKDGQLYIDVESNLVYYWESSSLRYKCLNISNETVVITKAAVEEVAQQSVFNGGSASSN
jgi:hypothetical protein